MATATDEVRNIYGYLTVIERAPNRGSNAFWRCECKCGTIRIVRGSYLHTGHTVSCGCAFDRENHGHSVGKYRTPEYRSWLAMIERCYSEKSSNYYKYGARGIKVCSQWRHSFSAFLDDMGPRPSLKHSIDRINNNKGYSPENCRWATRKEQARNTRRNHIVKGKTLTEWAEISKIHISTIYRRLDRGVRPVQAIQPIKVRS